MVYNLLLSTDCEGERQMSFIENYKRARRERLEREGKLGIAEKEKKELDEEIRTYSSWTIIKDIAWIFVPVFIGQYFAINFYMESMWNFILLDLLVISAPYFLWMLLFYFTKKTILYTTRYVPGGAAIFFVLLSMLDTGTIELRPYKPSDFNCRNLAAEIVANNLSYLIGEVDVYSITDIETIQELPSRRFPNTGDSLICAGDIFSQLGAQRQNFYMQVMPDKTQVLIGLGLPTRL